MTRPISIIAAAVLLAAFLAADSLAQGRRMKYSRELSTVTELHIETGRMDQQAQGCGIRSNDLEASVRGVIGSSRLSERQSASNFLFVNAIAVADGDACAGSVTLELFRWSNEYQASVSVWEHASLITGNRDGFNARVREKVDAMTRDFVEDWMKSRR